MEVRPESFSPKVGARLPPCGACGSQATGYHYGVNTCEACKEFFHRSLGRYKGYRCRNRETSGLCVYQPGKRKSCQFCRFQRCLRAGMSKGAIKIGRYSTVKKNRDEKEIKRINCGSGKEFSDTFDKTSLDPNSTSSSNDTGTPPYIGQTDSSCQENHLSNYNGSISSYLDTSVKKESNCKFTLFGLDMPARYPLSPYDSQPSPSILEDTKGLTKADSSTKSVNSGICIGHTSSPSTSFMPGESSSVLTPVSVSESSPTGMDGLEFPPFSPTSLNGADFHCNLKTQAEHDFKFQNRILTPKSDSSLGWWGSSESGLSPSDGERKQVHIMQMDHELSVTECQEDGSKKEETGEVSDCTSRIPSPSNEKDCMLYSGMVTGSHERKSKSEVESKSEYQDAVEVKDNCETQRKRLIKNFMEPSKGPLSEEVSDPSKFRSLSPLSSREGSPDSLPDVPNHSEPKVARGSLLPSQLPQLFADIDDVIKNLLAVHDENVADFTQVPKEEMIGHQLKHLELYDLKVSTLGHIPPLVSADEYASIFTLTGIDVDSRKVLVDRYVEHMQMYSRAMVRFARCIPGFFSLEKNQQVNLIDGSRIEFILLTIYPTFNVDIGVGISIAGGWICHEEVHGFAKACYTAIEEFCDRLQKLDISKEEMVLIKAMLIVTTDRKDSIDSPLASAIHWQLFQLLSEVTARRHKDATMALAGFMSILHETRSVALLVNNIKHKYRPELDLAYAAASS